MSLLWTTATRWKRITDFPGIDGVDDDAPGYFPRHYGTHDITIHPDEPLIATQDSVDMHHPAITHFDAKQANQDIDNPPSVHEINGDLYINDGHHRIIGARVAGKPIQAKLHYALDDGEDY